jgi:phage terminase small subunit
MPITPKKQRFVDEYLVDLNATQAAIRAGYSAKTAHSQGPRLLDDVGVKELIADAMAKRSEATKITAERVLQEVARLAFLDIRKAFNHDGTLKAINELDDDTAASIAGMDVYEEFVPADTDEELEGQPHGGALKRQRGKTVIGSTKKMKLVDKVGALTLAMRHLGMLTDKLEVKDTTTRADRLRLARERKAKA